MGRWPSWAHSDGVLAYDLGKYEFNLNISIMLARAFEFRVGLLL